MNIYDELEKLQETLLQQRDEMRLQAGLAKLEAKDEWEKVEEKVDHFIAKLESLRGEAATASDDVSNSAKQFGEEIKSAYERLKTQL